MYLRSKICAPQKVDQNSPNFGGMLLTKAPNQPKFCRNRLKNEGYIRDQKFVLPEKVGQNSPQSLKICYPLTPPPIPSCHISSRSNHIAEKRYKKNFYTLQYFGSPASDQRSPVWLVGYTKPPLAICKISSRSDDPMHSEISAAKLRRFCCLRDPQKDTQNMQ